MRFVGYNIVPLGLLTLAGWMMYIGEEGWGWCIFGAIVLAAGPSYDKR